MTEQSYTPRRRHRRFAIADIPGSLAFTTQVEIVNLSLAGVAVDTAVPLPRGKKFAVRIGKPEEQLDFQGLVCWSRLAESSLLSPRRPTTYRSGLAFADVLTEPAQNLLRFMERNIEVAVDHQLFGRLQIEGETSASLETDFPFEVQTLSAGGFSARISQPLSTDEVFEVELNLGGSPFITEARVVGVEASATQAEFNMGVEFFETRPDQLDILSGFLRQQFEHESTH